MRPLDMAGYDDRMDDQTITRQQRRAERTANGRKMRVSGRSVLLLASLTGVSRRRVKRTGRKRGQNRAG